MAFTLGTRIGTYEILEPLGAGGMGEVYRARDAKLNRDVAIKVLPELFSADPDRLARFRREAQVLASLNHQNIGHIYGLEDQAGVHALVLELVDGPTLADRIAQGPIPLDEAIPIATQIADALECAHEQGIIHRDLKPANIKLRPDGTVKVLDFGLAKGLDPISGSSADAMNSPTLTARGTQLGIIVGTAAYMAPEQARGRVVDRRADIWAFGVVLYEMLTGQRAFEGDDVSITLASVLKDDVDWKALPADLPPSVVWVMRRCLEKDPKRRLSAIADARLELLQPLIEGRNRQDASAAAPPRTRSNVPWVVAGGAGALALAFLLAWAPWQRPSPAPPTILEVTTGAVAPIAPAIGGALALSPNGRTMAFVALEGGRRHLFVRHLDQLQATRLAGTEDALSPFFSPDGEWIGFFTVSYLKRIAVSGGAAVTITSAGSGAARGGSWGDDGTIVFQVSAAPGAKLMRVPATGGTSAPLVANPADDGTQRWPQMLPGSRAVIYSANTAATGWDSANIVVQPLPSGTARTLVTGGFNGQYLANGHLLYVLRGTLFAVPFDLQRLEVTGNAVAVREEVTSNTVTGGANYAVSNTGTLAYMAGRGLDLGSPISLLDEAGKVTTLHATPIQWQAPRFSPKGDKIALLVTDGSATDVHVYDIARQRLDKITFEPGTKTAPVWTPDGTRVVYSAVAPDGALNLYWRRADGTGDVGRLTTSRYSHTPYSFDQKGRYLAFSERGGPGAIDLMILPLEGDEATGWKPGTPRTFLSTPHTETFPMFSPDGRWIAYMSNPGTTADIFVRSVDGKGGPWQVSTGGGIFPTWSQTRKEILYVPLGEANVLMAASYTVEGNSFRPGNPRRWTPAAIRTQGASRTFDLAPNGRQVVVAIPPASGDEAQREFVLILNFGEKVRQTFGGGTRR